jgi:hypothetical protein
MDRRELREVPNQPLKDLPGPTIVLLRFLSPACRTEKARKSGVEVRG